MPIQLIYTDDGAGVEFIGSGILTGADIIAANNKVYANDNFLKQRYQIIDRAKCTEFHIGSKGTRIIAD